MSVVLDATVGGANSNSFVTLAEAQDYFLVRPVTEWDDADSQEMLLILATRVLVAWFLPSRKLVRADQRSQDYYLIRPTWTGEVASTTQKLPWPRSGMYDGNGNAILTSVIPDELKWATCELAGAFAKGERLDDNDVAVQGISSVRAGSVSVSFKSAGIDIIKTIPDAVFMLLVPSWLTDEIVEPAMRAEIALL